MIARMILMFSFVCVAVSKSETSSSGDVAALSTKAFDADDECHQVAGETCSLQLMNLRANKTQAQPTVKNGTVVRILHVSDTHDLHNEIASVFPLPPADILIYSGDFTNKGEEAEFASANEWMGTLKPKYKHILGITGNHDWINEVHWEKAPGAAHAHRVCQPWATKTFFEKQMSNVKMLWEEKVDVMGLSIYFSTWKGEQMPSKPAGIGPIPKGIDILVTHGPAHGILDWSGGDYWGGSKDIFEAVQSAAPKAHLFGHVHEQRGYYLKGPDGYAGHVEFVAHGQTFPTDPTPPPKDYPPQLISNTACMNAPGKDGEKPHIQGGGRLILATMVDGEWQFSLEV